jgi:hypothetical protein
MPDKKNVYWVLAGKAEGTRPLGTHWQKSVVKIKMYLKEKMGW